jgi:hypothetical protein
VRPPETPRPCPSPQSISGNRARRIVLHSSEKHAAPCWPEIFNFRSRLVWFCLPSLAVASSSHLPPSPDRHWYTLRSSSPVRWAVGVCVSARRVSTTPPGKS